MRAAGVALGVALVCAATPAVAASLVVGSKNFEENRLLAEIAAQLVEAKLGVAVARRFNLAGTQVCFEALRHGAIDLYPEYTGTGLMSILGESAQPSRADTLRRVRQVFLERWDLWWLAPLGFENAYALGVPRELAQRHGLRTISDLVPLAPRLVAAFGYEFVERPDGLPGLAQRYGLHFGEVRTLQQTLKYDAIAARRVDCIDVYTTDGRLRVLDLAVLEDDRGAFPPYEAALLVRGEALRRLPGLAATLGLLAGAFDEATMQRLNLRLQQEREPVERVAREAVQELGWAASRSPGPAPAPRAGLWSYLWIERAELLHRTAEHLALALAALALGALVAVPLAMWLLGHPRLAEPWIRLVGVTQTIPSIALLAFMVPWLGVGTRPALVALWIYSVFPMLRNTYTGLTAVPSDVLEAGLAMGMTPAQLLRHVRLPLAVPVILAGVRTSAVLLVGTATLAAFIGAGGLGVPIVSGLQMADPARILSGALPAALLALVVDRALAFAEARLRPRGV